MRYSDSWEPLDPNSGGMKALFVFNIVVGVSLEIYKMWRDVQHHRFVWWHWVGLLASLYMAVLLCRAIRQAWLSVCRSRDERRASALTAPPVGDPWASRVSSSLPMQSDLRPFRPFRPTLFPPPDVPEPDMKNTTWPG